MKCHNCKIDPIHLNSICRICYVTNYSSTFKGISLKTREESLEWIKMMYKRGLRTDLTGLIELIWVWESLGFNIIKLDTLKPGEQLARMWEDVNGYYLEKEKTKTIHQSYV